jgi:sRNA-binding regulator protein Hfq
MQLPTDRAVTVRFIDGKELTVKVREFDQLGILVESAEGQARTIVIPWSAINQVTWP